MLLKSEKDVNASLRKNWEARADGRQYFIEKEFLDGKKKNNKTLALALSCGRLAAFTALLFRILGCARCRSEEGREIHSGGRATWASFFWLSSG